MFVVCLTLVVSCISLHCRINLNLWLKKIFKSISEKKCISNLQFVCADFPFKYLQDELWRGNERSDNCSMRLTCSCSEKELSSIPSFNQVIWGLHQIIFNLQNNFIKLHSLVSLEPHTPSWFSFPIGTSSWDIEMFKYFSRYFCVTFFRTGSAKLW